MSDITSFIGFYSEVKQSWTKRFAGIANGALFVYKTDGNDHVEVLNIQMKDVDSFEVIQSSTSTIPLDVKNRPFTFSFQTKQQIVYYFDCRTEEILHSWIVCFQKYVDVTRTRSNSSIVEGLTIWKNSAIYDDIIEALTSTSIQEVKDILALPIAKQSLFSSFIKNRSEKIDEILKNMPENSHIAYILLEFTKYIPLTQFLTMHLSGPEETVCEPEPPKIDFDSISKKRGAILENPHLKSIATTPGSSQLDPTTNQEKSELDTKTTGAPDTVSQAPAEAPRQRLNRRKRTAPTKASISELLSSAEEERGTLTEIKKPEEETVIEKPSVPGRIPGTMPMMGMALPQGDLRSVLKKSNPTLPPRRADLPVPESPSTDTSTTPTSQPSQSQLKSKFESKSQEKTFATQKLQSNVNPQEIQLEEAEPTKEVTPADPVADDVTSAETTDPNHLKSKIEKRLSMGMWGDPSSPILKMEIPQTKDFRSILKKRSDPSPQTRKEDETPKQFDFRSVLRKTQPPPAVKKEEEPKQFDFRSVLKKTQVDEKK